MYYVGVYEEFDEFNEEKSFEVETEAILLQKIEERIDELRLLDN